MTIPTQKIVQLLYFLLVSVLAVGLAWIFFIHGGQDLYFDALGYYELGTTIAQQGLWNFSSDLRTYGYPLFVAICWLLGDHTPVITKFVVFALQLALFLGTCAFAAFRIKSIKGHQFACIFFACTALNPLLLIYTTVVLTDLLSALCIFWSILLSIEALRFYQNDPDRSASSGELLCKIFFAFFITGLAVMIRPANLSIIAAVILIWFAPALLQKKILWREWLVALIGLGLPFTPQIFANWKTYQEFQPLIKNSLYAYQMQVGILVLKYSTLVIPGLPSSVPYVNPFLPMGITTPGEFFMRQPLGYAATLGAHLFAIFDQDFPFPYIKELHPWYRYPLSIANYTFLFIALVGVGTWLNQFLKHKSFEPSSFLFGGMLLSGLVYLPTYMVTAVESRFALPEYLLASPFFVLGIVQINQVMQNRQWKKALILLSSLMIILVFSINLSLWLQAQATDNLFNRPPGQTANNPIATNVLNLRLGERIQLLDYTLTTTSTLQGGNSIFLTIQWQCNGATTDAFTFNVDLVDDQDRIWAQGLRYLDAPVSPCPAHWWEPQQEKDDILTFKLSPAMPAGKYRITVLVTDRVTGSNLPVYNSAGQTMNDRIVLTKLTIAKNQASIEASQLNLKHPLFVDLGEIRFIGFEPLPDQIDRGQTLPVRVYWRARGKPLGDYTVSIQLRAVDHNLVAEQSSRPAGGNYPTTAWTIGEVLLDWHDLEIPLDVPPGNYQVFVELDDEATHRVLGQVALTWIEIK